LASRLVATDISNLVLISEAGAEDSGFRDCAGRAATPEKLPADLVLWPSELSTFMTG